MAEDIIIDTAALQAEIDSLDVEALKEQLLDIRVRAKVAQKKYYNADNAKKYAAKARERAKLLKAAAERAGILDEIEEEAGRLADEKLAEASVAAS